MAPLSLIWERKIGERKLVALTLLLITLVPTLVCEVTYIVRRQRDPIATHKYFCSLLALDRDENTRNPKETQKFLLWECPHSGQQ